MAKVHTTNPKERKIFAEDPYKRRRTTPDAMAEIISMFTRYAVKYFSDMPLVEFNLNRKTVIKDLVREIANPDPIELRKFILVRFYKEMFHMTVDPKFMKFSKVEGSDMNGYMFIPAELSFERVIKRARKIFTVTIPDRLVDRAGSRLGYQTAYSFLYYDTPDNTKGFVKDGAYDLNTDHRRFMNSYEYLVCRMFTLWYSGNVMDEKTHTLLTDPKLGLKDASVASSTGDEECVFQLLGIEDIESQAAKFPMREIVLLR